MPPVCCAKTAGPISDCVLQGVRHLFTVDGQLISSLDQLVDGRSYVCSSTLAFRRLDYEAIQGPTWIKQFKVCSLPHLGQTVQGVLFAAPGSNSSRCALCRTWVKQFKVCSLPHHDQTVQGVLFAPPGSNSSRCALCPTWIKQFKVCSLPHLDQTVQALLFAAPGSNSSSSALCPTWIRQFKVCSLPHLDQTVQALLFAPP